MKIQVRQRDNGMLARWMTTAPLGPIFPPSRETPVTNCAACWTRELHPEWSEWDVPDQKVLRFGLHVTCQACGKQTAYGQLG